MFQLKSDGRMRKGLFKSPVWDRPTPMSEWRWATPLWRLVQFPHRIKDNPKWIKNIWAQEYDRI